jgi:hypothetical protein
MLGCSVGVSFVSTDSWREASGSFALTKKKIHLRNEIDLCNAQSSLLMMYFDTLTSHPPRAIMRWVTPSMTIRAQLLNSRNETPLTHQILILLIKSHSP